LKITRAEETYRVSKYMCDHRNPERGPMFQLGTTGKMLMIIENKFCLSMSLQTTIREARTGESPNPWSDDDVVTTITSPIVWTRVIIVTDQAIGVRSPVEAKECFL
jgi:hypothetical protein